MTMSTAAAVQAGEAATCRTRWCTTFWSRRVFIGGKTTCISFISILVAAVPLFVLVISTYSASPTSSPRASPTSTPWQILMMAIKMETSNSGCSCRYAILLSGMWLVDGTCIFSILWNRDSTCA